MGLLMSQFVKSILNYYAAFTETRFSNKSTLNYKWLDDANLSLDLSFFADFFKIWATKLETGDRNPVEVRANQYKIDIPATRFRAKLSEILESEFNQECLRKYLTEEMEGRDPQSEEEAREIYLEAARSYNLALRKAIEKLVQALQREEIKAIQQQFHATRLPPPTFNVPKFSQDIYDSLQGIASECGDEKEYFQKAVTVLNEREYDIVLYDLLNLLTQFCVVVTYGTPYIFIGSIKQDGVNTPDYPLCFIEINLDSGVTNCIRLTIPRDLVMLNTPAINSFDFKNVLTIPRAASFSGGMAHLRQLDSFLTGEYSLAPQAIATNEGCFIPPPKETLPFLKYRFGLQVVKNEDKRVLDYSELMTKIERGEGTTITRFVDDYIKGEVISTYDETLARYREDYPKNTARYFYSDNPLPLNPAQKKILTALANKKNHIIVVDGPPGTGKSHTIGAITYWANQNKKSILITSHKKEALDVVERMLTDKFKALHPQAKPSIIRIAKSKDLTTLNTIENSLSLPVIDGAAKRADGFNLEAIKRDQEKARQALERTIDAAFHQSRELPQRSRKILKFAQLEEELGVKSAEISGPITSGIADDLKRCETFGSNHALPHLDGISLETLSALFQRRQEIPRILDACNKINRQQENSEEMVGIDLASLRNLEECKALLKDLVQAFDLEHPLSRLTVKEIQVKQSDLIAAADSFQGLEAARLRLNEFAEGPSLLAKIGFDKKYAAVEGRFQQDYPRIWNYGQRMGLKPGNLLEKIRETIDRTLSQKNDSSYSLDFIFSLGRHPADFARLASLLAGLMDLKFDHLLRAVGQLLKKDKEDLTLKELDQGLKKLTSFSQHSGNLQTITRFQEAIHLPGIPYRGLYLLLDQIQAPLTTIDPQTIDALRSVRDLYSHLLKRVGVDFSNLASLGRLNDLTRDDQKLLEFLKLHADLSQTGTVPPEIGPCLNELARYNQRLTEHANDLRLKEFQNHPQHLARIKRQIANGQRLTSEQVRVLCDTYSCIIAEPEAIFKYFPMEEGLIDILIFDEASQVSIAHSLSLILRAKQVLVFGDRYQYGAVSAVNVSRKYGGSYFRRIIDDYVREYNQAMTEEEKVRLIEEETQEVAEEDLSIQHPIRDGGSQLAAHKEWLKAFGIRMSTLDFCQEVRNYHTSLDEHFRSFPEIIDYSNEFFYRQAQIPLIVNRLRTKPIDQVLRFIRVETQGNSGKNVNLDEIEAIRLDIERLTAEGFRGTIGIITSFKEQKTRTEHYLREKLPNFHRLKEEHKFSIWFVGDVQGEERDIVYYSLVQDKKIDNADLRTIYPAPGGTADNINSLKMQRLNVGFSRAKDTMVFVHSMDLGQYADSRLGDAIKHYQTILEEARRKDHFIIDETVFDSSKEKELYSLLTQSDFYRRNKERLKIIPQFDIGKYIQQEYQKHIPRYRVDFLMTLAEGGKEKSLILEYDGLEYHTKDPAVVNSLEDFKEEYLDYDIARQLELESYGYRFLRINKFTLLPRAQGQTRLDVLNAFLEKAFAL